MNASEIKLKIKELYADEKAEVKRVLSEIGVKYDCERKALYTQLREIQQNCDHANFKSEWVPKGYYDEELEHTCLDCLRLSGGIRNGGTANERLQIGDKSSYQPTMV